MELPKRAIDRAKGLFACRRSGGRGQAITEYVLIIGLIVIPLALLVNELADVAKEFLARYVSRFWGPGI
jgi:hypothetical protein